MYSTKNAQKKLINIQLEIILTETQIKVLNIIDSVSTEPHLSVLIYPSSL